MVKKCTVKVNECIYIKTPLHYNNLVKQIENSSWKHRWEVGKTNALESFAIFNRKDFLSTLLPGMVVCGVGSLPRNR